MYRFLLYFLCIHSAVAKEALSFKKELVPDRSWLPYVLISALFVIIGLISAIRGRNMTPKANHCKLIERVPLHNKTAVYIISYHEQSFMVAENTHSLTIHALQPYGNSKHERQIAL